MMMILECGCGSGDVLQTVERGEGGLNIGREVRGIAQLSARNRPCRPRS